MRKLATVLILFPIVVLLLNGCTQSVEDGLPGKASNTSANTYHPAGWKDNPQHGIDYSVNEQNCKACHGENLKGGPSGVSCVSCHHSDPTAYQHGGTAAHIVSENCDGCHGDDLTGGHTSTSCKSASCHPNRDKCAPCHKTLQSHPLHTVANSKGPTPLACEDCHAADPFNYTVFADGNNLADSTDCDTCHSPNGAYDGVSDAVIGAKANWDNGIYEADGTTLKSDKEEWCASCHDDEAAFSKDQNPVNIVVDNDDQGGNCTLTCEETWYTSTAFPDQRVGDDYRYHSVGGTGNCTATWQTQIPMAGTYNVYASWTTNSYRATSVPYTINYTGDGGGSDIKWVNQQEHDFGKWYLLGTYNFDAGTTASVVLSADDSSGGTWVIADAIRWENPESMGAYAPNVVGDNATYGYYVEDSGHNLNCTVCHDASKDHIDHNPRTYEVAEPELGDPDPEWVVVNAYEDGYRLGDVLGQRPMVIPKETVPDINNLDPSEFALCFKCHDSDAILHYSPDGTNFYNDDTTPQNSHWIHLRMSGGMFWDSDWDAVIGGTNGASLDSISSCTTCHNVHGSRRHMMIRYGDLISTPDVDKTPAFDFCYLDGVESKDCTIINPSPLSEGGFFNCWGAFPEGGNGVCKHCHTGYVYYYRTAKDIAKPANPVVSNPQVVPSNIANDGSGSLLFSAFVVDPNGDLSSVEIDLSSLGGSSNQAMYDDGTNGDETPGDETYSYRLFGTTEPVGNKTVTITATDSLSNIGTEQVIVVVHDEYGAYIVDNEDTTLFSVIGAWETWDTNCVYFGTKFHYHPSGPGAYSATWQVRSDMPAGTYRVYAIWCANTYRDDDVYYTINHSGGPTVVGPFNQKQDDGIWVDLGEGTQTFTFDAGSGSVVVSGTDSDGIVNAEAIKWEPVP